MDFIEIAVVDIDGEAAETVSDLFNRYGYGGAVIETNAPDFDKVTVRTVLPGEADDRLRHIELMLALIARALPQGLPEARLQFVGKSDWAESWKEHFHVVRVGRQFVIKPSWRKYFPTGEEIVIEIDPGLAFGSGLHPTTQLCLNLLEAMPLSGQSFFDVGTGSGILSIAAAKLGANPIRAVDTDEVAVQVARENFKRNGLSIASDRRSASSQRSSIETALGSAAAPGGRRWQIVTANILAHILINIMPDLAAALSPGGRLILSGIITDQEAEVIAAAAVHDLHVTDRRLDGDWVALVMGDIVKRDA